MHVIEPPKWRLIVVKTSTCFVFVIENNDKNLMFKIGDCKWISKHKNILSTGYTPNWSEKVFMIKKIKTTLPWTYFIRDLKVEQIVEKLYEKELQKANKSAFGVKKVIKYKPCESSSRNLKVGLYFSNHRINIGLKRSKRCTSNVAEKSDLASFQAEVDKLDIDQPVDLPKLSNVANNDVVRKTVHYWLATKVSAIHSSKLVKKSWLWYKNWEKIGKKIKFLIRLNITTPEFDKSTKENLNERLKHSHLASKNDIDDYMRKTDCDDKPRNINSKNPSNKEKHVEVDKKS